jgi:hypothetical protein
VGKISRLHENSVGRANKTTEVLSDSTTIKRKEVAQQEVEISPQTGEHSNVCLFPFSLYRNYL